MSYNKSIFNRYMDRISEIDLILNPDGSVYHLCLHSDEIADTIITVGDPGRVEKVSHHFDRIDVIKNNREFHIHTGWIGAKRISVISTGIGTGSIDIVLNELDALANTDLQARAPKQTRKSLTFIRIGTSCALQPEILPDSLIVSSAAIGLDGLMHFYKQDLTENEKKLLDGFRLYMPAKLVPYIASANSELMARVGYGMLNGITLTAPGFFGPQGRAINGQSAFPELISNLTKAEVYGNKITNVEMETAAIYGLAACLGHKAISFNVIIPNRASGSISIDSQKSINNAIEAVLGSLTSF